MVEHNHAESSLKRAWRDTGKALHTHWFWAAETMALAGGGVLGSIITPSDGSTLEQAGIPTGTATAAAALLAFIIFAGNFIAFSPRRQRNEARQSIEQLQQQRLSETVVAETRLALAQFHNSAVALQDKWRNAAEVFGRAWPIDETNQWFAALHHYVAENPLFGEFNAEQLNTDSRIPMRLNTEANATEIIEALRSRAQVIQALGEGLSSG